MTAIQMWKKRKKQKKTLNKTDSPTALFLFSNILSLSSWFWPFWLKHPPTPASPKDSSEGSSPVQCGDRSKTIGAVAVTESVWAEEWHKLDLCFRMNNTAVCDVRDRLARTSVRRWWWQTRRDRMKSSSEKGQWKEEMYSQSYRGNRIRRIWTPVAAGWCDRIIGPQNSHFKQ